MSGSKFASELCNEADEASQFVGTSGLAAVPCTAWLSAGRFLLAALATVVVYRAATQSIVYDEAFTYLAFASGSFREVFTSYTANNHVLFSALARLSVGLFGVSELALRLPTVVAAIVYFSALFALCRLMFGAGRLFFVTLATLSLNPFILDHVSAARGYGMALALFTVALQQLTQSVVGDRSAFDRRWLTASIALALSVSANLTFLFPALALACVTVSMDAVRRQRDGQFNVAYARAALLWFVAPAVVIAVALLAAPLRLAAKEHFFYGAATLSRSVQSLLAVSLEHTRSAWPPGPERLAADAISRFLTSFVVVPVVLAVCVSIVRAVRRGRLERVDQLLLLTAGTLALTLLGLVAAHRLIGLPYPFGRTGLYLLILFVLASSTLVRKLEQSTQHGARTAASVLLALLVLQVGRFATEFNTTYYYDWRYDSGTRAIFGIIAGWPRSAEDGPVRVAASRWLFGQSLEFYRVVRGDEQIAPIVDDWERGAFDYDFFVVSPGEDLEHARTQADVVYVHADSGATLLVSRKRRAGPAVR